MKKTLDINDYYFGVITATPEYLKSTKRTRLLNGVDYDPFYKVPDTEALIFGVPTLLKKETTDNKTIYIDEYHSRYPKEITYSLKEKNRQGLVLAYIKPFTYYYKEQPSWYLEEDIIKNGRFLELCEKHTYYISYSKLQKREAIITLENYEEEIMDDYLKDLLGEELFLQITDQNKEYVKDIDIQ